MSLVNDMLRDLDQRRKESSGSAASVSLTPAPEIPGDSSKRPMILYLVVALIIGAGVIAWFWSQQGDSPTTRQLNTIPQVVQQTGPVVPTDTARVSQTAAAEAIQVADVEIPDTDLEQAEAPDAPLTFISDSENVEFLEPEDSANALAQSQQESDSVGNSSATPDSAERMVEERTPIEAAVDSSESVETIVRGEQGSSTVDLTQAPTENVKDAAELTPEEEDLIAVQEALRLIADNNTATAYAILEQQIVENRYAHQSRETYAKLLMNDGNLLGAFELTEAGLGLSPNHSGFKKIKARLLIADGQLGAAVELLLSRAPEVGVDLEYHDILATAQLASRDYEGALISYTELVQQDQSQGKWWYGFAASQDSLGNSSAARQGYSQAVRLQNLSANLRRRSQERLAILSQ
ncbi:MAG: hypothetical protein MI746_16335 [Pseudomonadales bacterium]|nr:hypothetical protein [Pseudomonadales bacterium]